MNSSQQEQSTELDSESKTRFHWINILRPLLTAVPTGIAFYYDSTLLTVLLSFFLLLSVFWLWMSQKLSVERESGWLSVLPTSVDVVFITAFIYYTGGAESVAVLAYIYVTALCAMNTRVNQGLFAASMIALLFALMAVAVQLNWIPLLNIIGTTRALTWTEVGFVIFVQAAINFAVLTLVRRLVLNMESQNNFLSNQSADLHALNINLNRAQKQLRDELKVARGIQEALLPRELPDTPDFAVESRYISFSEVSGDYLDCFQDEHDTTGLLVADSAGHGVPAALVASMTKILAEQFRGFVADPAAFLTAINTGLMDQTNHHFVAATYMVYFPKTHTLKYTVAGNPPPYLLRVGQFVRRLTGRGGVLGIRADAVFSEHTIELQPGDKVVIYTDGVNECRNPAGVLLEDDQLELLLTGISLNQHEHRVADLILTEIQSFTGSTEFEDDVTLMVLNIKA